MDRADLNDEFIMVKEGNYFSDSIISIVITTYKRPILLKRAVSSALNQVSEVPFNIIIIDGDPISHHDMDEILEICDQITYFKTVNEVDMFSMINYAFELTNSKFISILHDDDELLPNYIDHMNSLINSIEEFTCIFNYPIEFDIRRSRRVRNFYLSIKKYIHLGMKPKQIGALRFLLDNPAISSGVLFNKKLIDNKNLFNGLYWPSSDFEFYSRLAIDRITILTPVCCSKYNWDENSSLRLEVISKTICMDYRIRRNLILSSKNLSLKNLFHYINDLILIYSLSKLDNLNIIYRFDYEIFQKFSNLNTFKRYIIILHYFILKVLLILPLFLYKTDKTL